MASLDPKADGIVGQAPGPDSQGANNAVRGYLGARVEPSSYGSLISGSAHFIADMRFPDELHAAFVRSDHAAANILDIDKSEAEHAAGVHAVLTGVDLRDTLAPLRGRIDPDERFVEALNVALEEQAVPIMAADYVRYVGEPVAVVVAESRAQAEDACELVSITYEPLEPVLEMKSATAAGAGIVQRHLGTNMAVEMSYSNGDFGTSPDDVVIEESYCLARQSPAPIECRGAVCVPLPGGAIEVWSSTQAPFKVKRAICASTGWPEERVRVRVPSVGGGFGQKVPTYAEEVALAYAVSELGRPVRWIEDRYENLISATQGRDQHHEIRLRVSNSGKIVSFEDDFLVDLGAHNFGCAGVVGNTAIHLLGPYRIPSIRVSGSGVLTNKTPTAQYRGAGRPEATFALERGLDAVARRLGIGPEKLREINLLGEVDLPYAQPIPYRDGVDIVYDGKDYIDVLRKALELIPDSEVAALRRDCGSADTRVGFGAATYMEATARGPQEPETARVVLTTSGELRVFTGAGSTGQGHETVLAQVAAGTALVPWQSVRVVTGDTSCVRQGLGSFASRIGVIAGSAVRLATERLVEHAADLAAELWGGEATHVEDGFVIEGHGKVSWQELAETASARTRVDPVLDVSEQFAPRTVTWTMGVHVAVVAVDLGTGKVDVLRYGAAHEGGDSINPRIVDGQLRGGAAQGVGEALLEEILFDESGQPTTVTLADYRIPLSSDVPNIRLAQLFERSQLNPLGAKGIGESGVIPGAAAIASAIEDAVDHTISIRRVPITPNHLLSLLVESTGK